MKNTKSMLDFEILNGIFEATIVNYKEVPALYDSDIGGHTDRMIRDAYIEVELRLDNNETLITRWYTKRLGYIMRNISAQFDGMIYRLNQLLEFCRTHSFTIEIWEDPRYGQQIEYDLRKIKGLVPSNLPRR